MLDFKKGVKVHLLSLSSTNDSPLLTKKISLKMHESMLDRRESQEKGEGRVGGWGGTTMRTQTGRDKGSPL